MKWGEDLPQSITVVSLSCSLKKWLLWSYLGIEKLFPLKTWRNHSAFFFPTSPVLRPTTTGYWTHLLQVARLTFKGTKVRVWVSSGLHSWDKIYFIRFGKKWTLHPWTASLREHIPVPHSLPPEVNEWSIAHKIIEWTFPWNLLQTR